MNADQADIAMRKLSRLADQSPYERVYGWRQVLEGMWRAGFEAGYLARSRDEQISERIAEQEARALSERTEDA